MQMLLRNGFPVTSSRGVGNDEMDRMVEEAEQRSVVVQGVRCVRFVAGKLTVEFHDGHTVLTAQSQTGWLSDGDATLRATTRPRDGVHPAVVVGDVAYGDFEVQQQ